VEEPKQSNDVKSAADWIFGLDNGKMAKDVNSVEIE
jgi:hypothetical protein